LTQSCRGPEKTAITGAEVAPRETSVLFDRIGVDMLPGHLRGMRVAGVQDVKLRVLHVIPSLGQGGAERLLADLISAQGSETDHHVIKLLAGEPFFPVDAAKLYSLEMTRRSNSPRPFWKLRERAAQLKPNLIHAWLYHGNFASVAAAGLAIPIVWSIHNTTLSSIHSKRRTRVINRICAGLSYVIPDRIVYAAQSARSVHERLGYAANRGLVIKNGINLAPFRYDARLRHQVRAEIGLTSAEFAVGCVGRFDPQKNQRLVVEAFASLAANGHAKLVLAGTGCTWENAELRSWLVHYGVMDRAILLGRRTDVPALLSAFDALAIGSSYGEVLPIVAFEAAAAGLPIVSTTIGIIASDVGNLAPFVISPSHIVPIGDAERMSQALADVHRLWLDGSDYRSERAAHNADALAEYSLERVCAQYDDLYRAVARR
jgi:glycosyltransferase involved in cell wall biosynthesis